MLFSIIIPTLNESETLILSLENLLATSNFKSQAEIIICDGGSNDGSQKQVQQFSVVTLNTAKGRAVQMNAGAQQAQGDWLIFLHADTHLPEDWMTLIQQCNAKWGRFDVRLSGHHWLFRWIEKGINLRSRKTSVATGDQVLFFQRDFFLKIGCFPDISLMEDIAITKKARKVSAPANIQQAVITSSRRWEKHGIIRTILLMWFLRFAYWIGVKPNTLQRFYNS